MTTATHALQAIHTATNDVLQGYREMSARAKPEIAPIVADLISLHERHAAEQAELLSGREDADIGDTSVQGTLNQAVVIVRDWVSDLDGDALPAVRKGEEALRDKYAEALKGEDMAGQARTAGLLRAQLSDVERAISGLPSR